MRTGRYASGERHPRARHTDTDVELAIELVEGYKLPAAEVAEKFEVSARTVRRWLDGSRRARSVGAS